MQGRVKFFRTENCWGLITDPETNQEYHVHINDIVNRRHLERNTWVSFDVSRRKGPKGGLCAINVVPIDCPREYLLRGTVVKWFPEGFLDLAEAHPEWRYHVHGASYYFGPTPGWEWNYAFFQVQIDPETRHTLSEDFFFADASRKLGHESFVLASERTYHTGEFDYIMNLPAIASHPTAPFM